MPRRFVCAVVMAGVLYACGSQGSQLAAKDARPRGPVVDPNAPIATLRVGLYPYVPRVSQFQAAISAAWKQLQPRVALQFVYWDGGYGQLPSADLDVFVFDAMFLDDFRERGLLRGVRPAELLKPNDFLPYTLRDVMVERQYHGIPMLGGAEFLIYRKGDEDLEQITTLSQLVNALGTCSYSSPGPPEQRGLMVGMAGAVANARLYFAAATAATSQWPLPLPWGAGQFDRFAVNSLQTLLQAGSYYNSTLSFTDPYQRARWFAQGRGRALAGPSDLLAALGPALGEVDLTLLPLSDDPVARRLFYAQLIGIHPQSRYPAWSLELANLMSSTEVLVASLAPYGGQPAQYLMPVRRSALRELGRSDPLYRKMAQAADRARPFLLHLGPRVRQWLGQAPEELRRQVRHNYPCGCDQPVSHIAGQRDAGQKCLATCGRHDGWTGQWRTGRGEPSVCVCRSCD